MKLATQMLLFNQTLNQVADVACVDAHGTNVTWRPTKFWTRCGGSASFALNLPPIFQLNSQSKAKTWKCAIFRLKNCPTPKIVKWY